LQQNGDLKDKVIGAAFFAVLTLADARRKLAFWHYDYNNVRPHSSLGKQTPAEARRARAQSESSAPDALARPNADRYHPQGLSL